MIVGNGMMAKKFAEYQHNKNVLIFASGVSNSKENRDSEFEREFNLLRKTIELNFEKHFVYFGTSSMYDPMAKNSPYVIHKLEMEQYVVENCESYNVFRISQVIGRANNPTLVNFIVNNIVYDKEFEVWERATRNLIAVDDVYKIVDYLLTNKLHYNKIINVANSSNICIIDFINIVEKILNKKARLHVVPKGFPFDKIDISIVKPLFKKIGIDFDDNYYEKSLSKIIYVKE